MNKCYRVDDSGYSRRETAAAHVETRSRSISMLFDRYRALLQANPDLFSLPEGYIEYGNELYNLEIMLSMWLKGLHERKKRLSGRINGLSERINRLSERINGLSGRINGLSERKKRLSEKINRLSRYFSTLSERFSTLTERFSTVTEMFSTPSETFYTVTETISTLSETFSTVTRTFSPLSETMHASVSHTKVIKVLNTKTALQKSIIRRYKMSFKKNRLDDFFQNSRDALTNAQNNLQFRTLLTNQNVDDARFLEGFAFLDRAAVLESVQKVKHLEKRKAYRDLLQLRDETQKVCAKHVKFARLCYRVDPGKLLMLGVSSEVEDKRNLNAWMIQTRFFYSHAIADTDLHPLLLRNGITLTELQDIERQVSEVEQANRLYREKVGEAQTAVDDRNQAIRDFKFWLSEFIAVCRVATADQPQMLEILKILVYSAGYKKKPKEKTPTEPGEETTDPPLTQPEPAVSSKRAAKKA